jgi:hypothetical protein
LCLKKYFEIRNFFQERNAKKSLMPMPSAILILNEVLKEKNILGILKENIPTIARHPDCLNNAV